MITFPSIEQYYNVIHKVKDRATFSHKDEQGNVHRKSVRLPVLKYEGTVKLYGTNTALSRVDGQVIYQSKNRELSITDDHMGFMNFMQPNEQAMHKVIDAVLIATGNELTAPIAIFGEWCGKGVIRRSKTAITRVPKMFVMFQARVNGEWVDFRQTKGIEFPELGIYNSKNFKTYELDIDFEAPYEARNVMVQLTADVEADCPVAKVFNEPGVGEGIVWTCVDPDWNSSEYWFKVKGAEHSETMVKVLTPVEIEELRTIDEFVAAVLTEARLENAVEKLVGELQKPLVIQSMGDFIRYIYNDVVKEEALRIEVSGFDVKKLGSPLANKARQWFFARINNGQEEE